MPCCTGVGYFYREDKREFENDYIRWKKEHFKSKSLFETQYVLKETTVGDRINHILLSSDELMTSFFERLNHQDKRSMSEVCRKWASLFAIGKDTSKMTADYKSQVKREEINGLIVRSRWGRVFSIQCCCLVLPTKDARYVYHCWMEGNRDMDDPTVHDDGPFDLWSEDEAYYD